MKTIFVLALGAALAASGAALAEGPDGSSAPSALPVAGMALSMQRYGDQNCDCNLPVVTVPFYTVRPAPAPLRVRAPGMRVSSPPVFAPGASVYIESPPIYVDAPPVNVAPSKVYLEAPNVYVRPSEVTVAPPEVQFNPAGPAGPSDCCTTVSPPAAGVAAPPPPPPAYYEPRPASGYAQEPGERG